MGSGLPNGSRAGTALKLSEQPDFDSRAAQWDQLPRRVALANAVVETIIREVSPQPCMRMLDYGAGTGLVSLGLLPFVKEAIAVDSSQGMLDQLKGKLRKAGINNLQTLFIDLNTEWYLPKGVDLLVSSMTMHHVPDVPSLLLNFRECMNPGGVLCIADLDLEDGSFHDNPVGVHHNGFAHEQLECLLGCAGFSRAKTVPVMNLRKDRSGIAKEYLINLTVGFC